MPAYNFQKRFAPLVLAGLWRALKYNRGEDMAAYSAEFERLEALRKELGVGMDTPCKRQTIRLCRKRLTRPGETLYLFTGMRQKGCIRLGAPTCKTVEPIQLQEYRTGPLIEVAVQRDGRFWERLSHEFAQADGFNSLEDMQEWFEKTHKPKIGVPIKAELITW